MMKRERERDRQDKTGEKNFAQRELAQEKKME
jgi:hypothetical protein